MPTTRKTPAPVDVDLDALRKARADGKRTKTFRAAGHTFSVAGKLPVYVAVLLSEGEVREALQLWLGDDNERIFAREVNPTQEDVQDLIKALYQVDQGEADASGDS